MAIRTLKIPSQDSLDKQLGEERRRGWFIAILLIVLGIALGGILGYLGLFDSLGKIIENLISSWAEA